MFRQRAIVTAIGIPLVIAAVWFDGPVPWLTVLGVLWGGAAAFEFYHIVAESKGLSPQTWFGLVWVALFIVSPHFDYPPAMSLLLVTAVILPLVLALVRRDKGNAFANWAWTIAGILYIGFLLSFIVALRQTAHGRGWVFLALLATFASDVFAYLVGRSFGRHKMAPYISPNKTWEGAAGGVAGAIAVALLVAYLLPWLDGGFPPPVDYVRPFSYVEAAYLGLIISVVGQLGDLVKSLFKRNMRIKDSSRAIPGHGGFMDRMDSVAFAGIAVYYYVFYLVGVK